MHVLLLKSENTCTLFTLCVPTTHAPKIEEHSDQGVIIVLHFFEMSIFFIMISTFSGNYHFILTLSLRFLSSISLSLQKRKINIIYNVFLRMSHGCCPKGANISHTLDLART